MRSVDTGEILDCVIRSHLCTKNYTNKNEQEFQEWFSIHKSVCCINHTGLSEAMETEGAKDIFLRSLSTRNLRYTTFVGDGEG